MCASAWLCVAVVVVVGVVNIIDTRMFYFVFDTLLYFDVVFHFGFDFAFNFDSECYSVFDSDCGFDFRCKCYHLVGEGFCFLSLC